MILGLFFVDNHTDRLRFNVRKYKKAPSFPAALGTSGKYHHRAIEDYY
ncbi:protein of unknown function [Lactiplantibacillus plantarum]|nr:conserved hypothetical protein [Lactiplantibacillus plantarum JDM1]